MSRPGNIVDSAADLAEAVVKCPLRTAEVVVESVPKIIEMPVRILDGIIGSLFD